MLQPGMRTWKVAPVWDFHGGGGVGCWFWPKLRIAFLPFLFADAAFLLAILGEVTIFSICWDSLHDYESHCLRV